MPGGFFGAGAGVWGLGDADALDVGIFGTGGFNLGRYFNAGPTQLYFEGRVFARTINDIPNNYSGIVGVRVNFKPHHRLQAR